jgi:hypothetical protein
VISREVGQAEVFMSLKMQVVGFSAERSGAVQFFLNYYTAVFLLLGFAVV